MTVSAVRWAVVDTIHSCTGLPLRKLDFSRLGQNVDAYALLIEIHYRHYLFYANMFVATGIAYVCYRTSLGGLWPLGWLDLAFPILETIFLLTSRDTLQKYYTRGQQLLASDPDAAVRNSRDRSAISDPKSSQQGTTLPVHPPPDDAG